MGNDDGNKKCWSLGKMHHKKIYYVLIDDVIKCDFMQRQVVKCLKFVSNN
jgi:hypothetical protein